MYHIQYILLYGRVIQHSIYLSRKGVEFKFTLDLASTLAVLCVAFEWSEIRIKTLLLRITI